MKKQNLFSILLIVCSLTFMSCNDDDDAVLTENSSEQTTIADIVIDNENYASLEAALIKTDLVGTLSSDQKFTVFAPDNEAFSTFLNDKGFDDLDAVPNSVLRQILLNHVISGEVMSGDISTGYVTSMAEEETSESNLSMYINADNGVIINGEVTVVDADIEADNGVIHAVDRVIDLPTVVTFATADPNFSTLVSALTREDNFTYVSTLSTVAGTSPSPFTVFAPTNAAFEDLLEELNVQSLEDIETATLASTLNMHVIANANVREEDLTSGTVTSLGGEIIIDAENATITDANNRQTNIIVTNVQASNGVIHAIDQVILPEL
ncbi:fasciclin domain-containing protein [Mesonia aestuariivivens]|uniref:Fasciclin domain-containing protein n=1 Tax=Mesonia aestuariivivens TaxID=2796128 RepID=A0ABS6W4T0_9FLAO|nr:fasciclin domain-containing protein [Mesonia aestuariivivens]MBW2962850.1 fasciclin domain-containing protein [Mesonia aestuariivivens]